MNKILGIGLVGAWEEAHCRRYGDLIATNGSCAWPKKGWIKSDYPNTKITGVWDNNSVRGQSIADAYSCKFEMDYDKFIEDPAIEAIIVCSEPALHGEQITKAANLGKHIFVEKAPFASNEDAEAACAAIKSHGVHFRAGSPLDKARNHYAKTLIESGKLGTVTEVRFRLYDRRILDDPKPVYVLNKEQAGGGALMDGQHGAQVLYYLLGMPKYVSAHMGYITDFAKKNDTEDTATAIFQYEDGKTGIIEVGFTAPDHESFVDIFGTGGRVHICDERAYSVDGKQLKFDNVRCCLNGGNTVGVSEKDMPGDTLHPLRQWVDSIFANTPDDRQTIDDAVAWTKMLMACYESAKSGKKVTVS